MTEALSPQFFISCANACNPPRIHELGKPLQGDKGGLWRYRVGHYRLICDIQDEKITVLVLRVGHGKGCLSLDPK